MPKRELLERKQARAARRLSAQQAPRALMLVWVA
jgi:hypothetical protein